MTRKPPKRKNHVPMPPLAWDVRIIAFAFAVPYRRPHGWSPFHIPAGWNNPPRAPPSNQRALSFCWQERVPVGVLRWREHAPGLRWCMGGRLKILPKYTQERSESASPWEDAIHC
jgi:hypothetical protein